MRDPGPRFAAVAEKFAGKVRFLKISQKGNLGLAEQLGVTAIPTCSSSGAARSRGSG